VNPGAYPTFVGSLPLTRRALTFAVECHQGQEREADRAAFILHPLEVAHLLHSRDFPDQVVAAGVLHDVVEDAGVPLAELASRFGARVAHLVEAVSEPPGGGPYAVRKARLRAAIANADPDALAIFAADKIAKTRELRLALVRLEAPSPEIDAHKLEHYWACLAVLEGRLRDHPLVQQLRFELEALAALPPAVAPGLAALSVPAAQG
jgi:(p)ppGpp synthase/HD superfamily hydrolase